MGGASIVQQALRTGLVDHLRLHIVPLLLGPAPPCSTGPDLSWNILDTVDTPGGHPCNVPGWSGQTVTSSAASSGPRQPLAGRTRLGRGLGASERDQRVVPLAAVGTMVQVERQFRQNGP